MRELCESHQRLIDQLPLYYEPGGPNNTYWNVRAGISELKAKAGDRGCFLMH